MAETIKNNSDGNAANLKQGISLRKSLLSGVAACAILAAVPSLYHATADAPVIQKNEEPGSLTLNSKAVALPDFTELVQRVKPAVVSVRVKEDGNTQLMTDDEPGDPFKGTPFEQFFKNFQNQGGGQWRKQWRRPLEAQGSGFFISADGYVVTNNHVVDHAAKVEIVTDDRETFEAKVLGTDPKSDLALLKVEGSHQFPFVTLAKTNPKIGEWIVAMGNPFGLGGSVTAGIVSAQGRDIGEGPYDNFIQIDAPINKGNSGGPTFNLKGEVIGVNTAIFSPSGGSVGVAFDIPAPTVETVIAQLQTKGFVERGWLGVQVQPVTPEIADSLGLKEAKGALISEPEENSPAQKAGLKSGDVITALNNTEIRDARDLAQKVAGVAPDTDVSLTFLRNGKPEKVSVRISQQREAKAEPAANVSDQAANKLGLALAPAGKIAGAGGRGVAVVGLDPNGAAADLGFSQGDIILKADGKDLSTPKEFLQALKDAKAAGRKHALVLVKHNADQQLYVAVPVAAG